MHFVLNKHNFKYSLRQNASDVNAVHWLQTGGVNHVWRGVPRSLDFPREIEDTRVRQTTSDRPGDSRASGRYPGVSAFVSGSWWKPVGAVFGKRVVMEPRSRARAREREREREREMGDCVLCVMYNSRSSLGSRVGNSGPSPRVPVPVISVAVARGERYIRPLTVTTSWRPFPSLSRSPLLLLSLFVFLPRPPSPIPRFYAPRRDALVLFSASAILVAQRYSLAAHIHSLSSHIPFLLSFPSVNFACQRVFCSGGGRKRRDRRARIQAVEQCHITPDNSTLFESFMRIVIVSQ